MFSQYMQAAVFPAPQHKRKGQEKAFGHEKSSSVKLKSNWSRRRPMFPGGVPPSIFGTVELNFRVRNGNGWILNVIGTGLGDLERFQCYHIFVVLSTCIWGSDFYLFLSW